jgi:hypothetical protein
MKDYPMTPEHRKAIIFALVLQTVLAFLTLFIIDGGITSLRWFYAFVGFWGGCIALHLRHPEGLKKNDLTAIRWGFIPFLFVSWGMSIIIWHYRGLGFVP